jgi:hypothetical protein
MGRQLACTFFRIKLNNFVGELLPRKFSTVWKTISRFFHAMENFFPHCGKTGPIFPRYGKILRKFSTV